eukprot:4699364-Amphidinium_carterae.1
MMMMMMMMLMLMLMMMMTTTTMLMLMMMMMPLTLLELRMPMHAPGQQWRIDVHGIQHRQGNSGVRETPVQTQTDCDTTHERHPHRQYSQTLSA